MNTKEFSQENKSNPNFIVKEHKKELIDSLATELSTGFEIPFSPNIFNHPENSYLLIKEMVRLATPTSIGILKKLVLESAIESLLTQEDLVLKPDNWIFHMLKICAEEKIRNWILASAEEIIQLPSYPLSEIFDQPALHRLMIIPYHELVALLSIIPDDRTKSAVVTWFTENYQVLPQLTKLLLKAGETISWDQRIRKLIEFQSILGFHWTQDEEMNQIVLALIDSETEDEDLREILDHFDEYTPRKQREVLAKLRNSLSPEQHKWLRLTYNSILSPEAKQQRQAEYEEKLQIIRFTEHPLHPWSFHIPYFGYEIETRNVPGFAAEFFCLLRAIGWHTGTGGVNSPLEFSPGPFHSPITARETFNALVDSNFYNIYESQFHTYHSNTQLSNTGIRFEIDELMVAADYAYHPTKKGGGDYYRLKPEPKHSGVTNDWYNETEGYAVLNKQDLHAHTDRYMALSTAGKAVEVLKEITKVPDNEKPNRPRKLPEEKKIAFFRRLKPEDAYLYDLPPETITLAQIWLEGHEAFREMHTNVLTQASEVKGSQYGSLGFLPDDFLIQEIKSIFPSLEDHLDPSNLEKETFPVTLEYQGVTTVFPNIIAASRYLTTRIKDQVFTILDQIQNDFISRVIEYQCADQEKRPQLAKDFLHRHPYYWRKDLVSNHSASNPSIPYEIFVLNELVQFIDTTLPASWRKNMTQETDEH